MFNLMDADIPFLGALYCIMMVVVGSFFLMNLILAVIIQAFIKIQKREIEEELKNLSTNQDIEEEIKKDEKINSPKTDYIKTLI